MKTANNPIEIIAERLQQRFPGIQVHVDSPGNPAGSWFLDVTLNDHFAVIEWRIGEGFGITCSEEEVGFGVGADEIYHDLEAAYARVVSLLLERSYTSPPVSYRLQELRKARGISQEDLAGRMEVRQAAISKLERRGDVLVSSVREVVRSMGGELRITARFPDGMERTLEFEERPAKVRESEGE